MEYPLLFRLVEEAKSRPDIILEVLFDGLKSGTITRASGVTGYKVGQHNDWWAPHHNTNYWEPVDGSIWVDAIGISHKL